MGAREMKDTKNILLLGGYGRTGMEIAKMLLGESQHNIHLAGRDLFKASRAAMKLNWEHSRERVRGVEINAALKKKLTGALGDYDLVIVSIPNTAFGGQIAQAAFDAGIDYINLNASEKTRQVLRKLDKGVREAGLTFITEAGFVPGAPSLMARYVAEYFDSLDTVNVGAMFGRENGRQGGGFDGISTPGESPALFRNGRWQKAGLTASRKISFGNGAGIRTCYLMGLAELRGLPEKLGCRELGFYGSGANQFAELTRQMWRACRLPRPSKGNGRPAWPGQVGTVTVTATGTMNGLDERLTLTLEHRDPYLATAMTTVPCVLGLLDGSIKREGVHMMGHLLDPERYMEDLWDMGMTVSLQGLPDQNRRNANQVTSD
jgi:saccharopine dehydrogenase (NAD+, L-lysine-forming)